MKNLFRISVCCCIPLFLVCMHAFLYSTPTTSSYFTTQHASPGDTVYVKFSNLSADHLPQLKMNLTNANHFEWIAWCEALNVACVRVNTNDEQIEDLLKSIIGAANFQVYPQGSGSYTLNDKCFVY